MPLAETHDFKKGFKEGQRSLIIALRNLTEFCTSGRRYQTQNPYTVPEIKAALQALAEARGLPADAWMDANKNWNLG